MLRPAETDRIPETLRRQLAAFRRSMLRCAARWALAVSGLITVCTTIVFLILERITPTPVFARLLLCGIIVCCLVLAAAFWLRLMITRRTKLGLARYLRRLDPSLGDHLVGALELSANSDEQARSPRLCAAAVQQVAERSGRTDLNQRLPAFPVAPLAWCSTGLVFVVLIAAAWNPAMIGNGLARLFAPLSATPRFTLVRLDDPPKKWIVPRSEPSTLTIQINEQSDWIPETAAIELGLQTVNVTAIDSQPNRYSFQIPGLFESRNASVLIGDAEHLIRLIPRQRPELTHLRANVKLPDYLADVLADDDVTSVPIGGVIKVIEGGEVTVNADFSAPLSELTLGGEVVSVQGSNASFAWNGESKSLLQLNWVDADGLSAARPLDIRVQRVPDRIPTVSAKAPAIPARVLTNQALVFNLSVQDDFAIRRVGMQWSSDQDGLSKTADEKVLGSGDASGSFDAIFQASALDMDSSVGLTGQIYLRFWAEDHYPNPRRGYSDTFVLNILSADEHAVWIADQFDSWRESAMDVRDRELNLYQKNRELSETDLSARDQAWRDRIEQQAKAERSNGRRLESVASQGEALLQQAARNDAIATEYVQSVAETIQTLQQMSQQNAPRVAQLLEAAAEFSDEASTSPFAELADQESSQAAVQQGTVSKEKDETGKDSSAGRVSLAGTTILDSSKPTPDPGEDENVEDPLKIAIDDQTELVAQFDAVADQLRNLMGKMQGSTMVKRLKAVSRMQESIATQLARNIEASFGSSEDQNRDGMQSIRDDLQSAASQVRRVLDDLEAFCERRQIEHFAAVLDQMKQSGVLARMDELGQSMARQPGVSIAKAEYWADTLDRWADELVPPNSGETEPGTKPSRSVPPAIVLEVLRILESQVTLREQTRMAEQGRDAMDRDAYMAEAIRLSEAEDLLRDRVDLVIEQLESEPQGVVSFNAEIEVLGLASTAMVDASKILVAPETGKVAIAAQTEAIELLLRSNQSNADGEGGSSGGAVGSSGGDTSEAALRLVGRGLNERAILRASDTKPTTRRMEQEIPQRWRSGLQRYYDRLEQIESEASQP